jgi:hypothetical protein
MFSVLYSQSPADIGGSRGPCGAASSPLSIPGLLCSNWVHKHFPPETACVCVCVCVCVKTLVLGTNAASEGLQAGLEWLVDALHRYPSPKPVARTIDE